MHASCPQKTIELVKASVPALEAMVATSPRPCTRGSSRTSISGTCSTLQPGRGGSQVHALAQRSSVTPGNREPQRAGSVVERIAHKHIGYHILP